MTKIRTYRRRRLLRDRITVGSNPGHCDSCGKTSSWRSVGNRCWQCETAAMKTRRTMYVDREVLLSAGSASD